MGKVYKARKARDTWIDRIVAIKVLPEHRSASPVMHSRLLVRWVRRS
jgi:hypothetical protein